MLTFLVIYVFTQQPAYMGLGSSTQLTHLQLESLLTEGGTSRFWLDTVVQEVLRAKRRLKDLETSGFHVPILKKSTADTKMRLSFTKLFYLLFAKEEMHILMVCHDATDLSEESRITFPVHQYFRIRTCKLMEGGTLDAFNEKNKEKVQLITKFMEDFNLSDLAAYLSPSSSPEIVKVNMLTSKDADKESLSDEHSQPAQSLGGA